MTNSDALNGRSPFPPVSATRPGTEARPTARNGRAQTRLNTAKTRRQHTRARVLSIIAPALGLTATTLFVIALKVA